MVKNKQSWCQTREEGHRLPVSVNISACFWIKDVHVSGFTDTEQLGFKKKSMNESIIELRPMGANAIWLQNSIVKEECKAM